MAAIPASGNYYKHCCTYIFLMKFLPVYFIFSYYYLLQLLIKSINMLRRFMNSYQRLQKSLKYYHQVFSHIENATFESALLKELQSAFFHQNKNVSHDITRLRKLLDKLDLRYNLVYLCPLNILLLWNLQQVLDLEKWKSATAKKYSYMV